MFSSKGNRIDNIYGKCHIHSGQERYFYVCLFPDELTREQKNNKERPDCPGPLVILKWLNHEDRDGRDMRYAWSWRRR
jgi:hypothetical protein